MDCRDRAAYGRSDGLRPNLERGVLTDTWDELGTLPGAFQICPTCAGLGKHVNPSIDAHGISPDEFAEDPEFHQDYCHGVYDVVCYECQGAGRILEPDWKQLTETTQLALQGRIRSHWEYVQEVEAERRMGC